jgi:hypothetical protein
LRIADGLRRLAAAVALARLWATSAAAADQIQAPAKT